MMMLIKKRFIVQQQERCGGSGGVWPAEEVEHNNYKSTGVCWFLIPNKRQIPGHKTNQIVLQKVDQGKGDVERKKEGGLIIGLRNYRD